tara:strand:+ start:554 stop:745 length:192 start_codon:yes stop_codon:yes gene_type:complete
MTENEKNASDKAQQLISRHISECGIDEDSAKKASLILIDELFKWGLPYTYQIEFWTEVKRYLK